MKPPIRNFYILLLPYILFVRMLYNQCLGTRVATVRIIICRYIRVHAKQALL